MGDLKKEFNSHQAGFSGHLQETSSNIKLADQIAAVFTLTSLNNSQARLSLSGSSLSLLH